MLSSSPTTGPDFRSPRVPHPTCASAGWRRSSHVVALDDLGGADQGHSRSLIRARMAVPLVSGKGGPVCLSPDDVVFLRGPRQASSLVLPARPEAAAICARYAVALARPGRPRLSAES